MHREIDTEIESERERQRDGHIERLKERQRYNDTELE